MRVIRKGRVCLNDYFVDFSKIRFKHRTIFPCKPLSATLPILHNLGKP